ncbi:ABC transporter permease [Mangrovibacterium diazotrophicum]|uniref:ABC-type lipoprotein release transport system permease subunit n=1 Tax=Mangrovibacterium diazotrophicum TaxID=1261403 RepID=A0A419W6P8_9BACT|nr:FtsX-like permease family protein [Mangrovibacterium diazotrophicum]RKD91143.1 ABC-type lipoprotein release transport system permease subunit [Mangrovibacterium diazotrophicum]
MILAIAWRNIWRSKTRSLVILTALTLGLASGIFYMAFYKGMIDQRINSAIRTEASHIQIHHAQYLQNPDKKFVIASTDSVIQLIQAEKDVKAVSYRTIVNTMIQSPTSGSGAKVTGIDPTQEAQVTNLHSKLIDGDYFDTNRRNPIIIGKKLADKLKVKLKSKVVITLQDLNGNITGAAFKVAGIYETSNTTFDEMNVFVRNADINRVLGLDMNSCHEIAILLQQNEDLASVESDLQNELPKLDIKSWREVMPEVSLLESSFGLTMLIFIGIILLALLFGIINTMLMAVLERTKELGMLMAIGMNRIRVFSMIMAETVMLSVFGGMCGMALGWLLNLYFGVKGIDLGAWSTAYKSMGFETLVYTRLSWSISLEIGAMVFITGIIASIYPAVKALRLNPGEAIRIDM